jgi:hypothetical protein
MQNPDFVQAICSLSFQDVSKSVVGNGGLCAVLPSSKLALLLYSYVASTLGLSRFKAVDMQIFLPSPSTPTFLFHHYNKAAYF